MEVLKNFLEGNPVAAEAKAFEERREEPVRRARRQDLDGFTEKGKW